MTEEDVDRSEDGKKEDEGRRIDVRRTNIQGIPR
jgi:hypothetical protein